MKSKAKHPFARISYKQEDNDYSESLTWSNWITRNHGGQIVLQSK